MMKHKNVINGCEYSDDGKILIRAALCYTSIVVPEGVEYIKEKAFYNVTTLQKIQLPSTILKIGARAFCGCRNLKELSVAGMKSSRGLDRSLSYSWMCSRK